jgi:hypothetical protein
VTFVARTAVTTVSVHYQQLLQHSGFAAVQVSLVFH